MYVCMYVCIGLLNKLWIF